MQIRGNNRSGRNRQDTVRPWTVGRLFAGGVQGVWYDPSDLSTLFQDSAGTTPVTAFEQPVGRMLDKSGRGNHATQPTAASRPTYSARVNLLEQSENFSHSSWGKLNYSSVSLVAHSNPFGASQSWVAVPNAANSAKTIDRSDNLPVSHVKGIFVKAKEYRFIQINWGIAFSSAYVNFDALNGSVTAQFGAVGGVIPFGNGWFFCFVTVTGATGAAPHGYTVVQNGLSARGEAMSGNGTSGIYLWGADLRPTNSGALLPPYQRVTTATDYDTAGFPAYLRFDGVDDYMTASLSFSQSPHFISAAVRAEKAVSDIVGTGSTAAGHALLMLFNGRARAHVWRSSFAVVDSTNTVAAPNTSVFTQHVTDTTISAGLNGLRNSAAQLGTPTTPSSTLIIGNRAFSGAEFLSGSIYGLIVRGAQTPLPDIQRTERLMAQKSGIVF